MTELHGHDWKIDLPAHWEVEEDEDSTIIYEEDGVGALQISGLVAEQDVTDGDLREFAAEHLAAGARAEAVELGEFSGFTFSYTEDDEHWREWYLRTGPVALFVTYNCDLEDRGVEDEAMEQVLGTLSRA
ncbi:hypothetical protein [Alkalilimnicola sp. S0819]|uniref:hypothetical protein n=1 Tax=Alkalilimnicola sp. S0819 TaxID=2613922 RepID=UPI0012625555|nr:hypothetical protein [Alkalilimnicola sp. S0819]KAB7624305.1 hypothetical protein F3N43_05715 [Alkalilimnicola sp. S0819]MPQ16129.1 hypothetical protein [Alkalilimnicola sp. S0819]